MNLSAKVFTSQQISLLSRGLSFSPACNFNLFDTIVDVNRFARQLTVRKHFLGVPLPSVTAAMVPDGDMPSTMLNSVPPVAQLFPEQVVMGELQDLYAESRTDIDVCTAGNFNTWNPVFYPVHARSPAIDRFQEMVEKDLCALQHTLATNVSLPNDNVSKIQRISLKTLQQMEDIFIRQADKGGSVTILDKGLYVRENKKLLADTTTYTRLLRDPTHILYIAGTI